MITIPLELLLTSLLLGVPAAYVVRCLLLRRVDDHEGPLHIPNWYVRFPDDYSNLQQFTLFDLVRMVLGLYENISRTYREDYGLENYTVWAVRRHWWVEAWTCPFCLSFWVAIPFAILLFPFYSPVIHFAIAMSAYGVYKYAFS